MVQSNALPRRFHKCAQGIWPWVIASQDDNHLLVHEARRGMKTTEFQHAIVDQPAICIKYYESQSLVILVFRKEHGHIRLCLWMPV